ncbi:MAG: SDR family NAD(P)-dependent oxidoreductase [Gemmatimonadales bacterium]|nr:MAG: SDR family NAD(P)-dependent oxidoreductase [Gemmatimonadales bacterium]
MSRIQDSTALITGGASGIGLGVGQRLLDRGASRLVIWDRDGDALDRAARSLAGAGRQIHPFKLDITDLEAVQATVQEMDAAGIQVDILVNNAGIVVGRDFTQHTHDDIRRTLEVNALAPMHLALELLPGMVERGRGHIVNIASAAGLLSNPRMSVYCASKWAMVGWSDSLRIELERGGTGVRVTTVLPYYIDTGMFAGVRSPFLPILRPERVTRAVVRAIQKDRVFVHLPRIVALVPLLRGLLPVRVFDRVVGDGLGIYRTMRDFRGREEGAAP